VVVNRKGTKTYDSLTELTRSDDIANTFEKSVRQDKTSEVLAYAAVGIWVTDIIWNLVKTSGMERITLGSNLDPLNYVPMIRVSYRF
jgi:hypothetical protein